MIVHRSIEHTAKNLRHLVIEALAALGQRCHNELDLHGRHLFQRHIPQIGIKDYVAKHGNDEQKESLDFMTKKRVDAESGEYSEPVSFLEIKNWFLNEFPELKKQHAEYRQKVQKILDAAANKAAA